MAVVVGLMAAPVKASALPRPLTKAEKKVVGARLAKVVNFRRSISMARGDTLFVVRRVRVDAKKLTGDPLGYEAVVTGFRGPRGLLIDPRVDEVKFKPKGGKIEVTFRYVVMAMPGATTGGRLFFTLQLIKREGIGSSVVSVPLNHSLQLKAPKPSPVDLTADFYGYRVYKKLAADRQAELRKKRVEGLRLTEDARLPPLMDVPNTLVKEILEFDKWRRRAFIARRHLAAGVSAPDRSVASLARKYLKMIDVPDDELASLPAIPLVEGAEPMATGKVETLPPPVAVAPKPEPKPTDPPLRPKPKPKPKKDGDAESLKPLGPTPERPRATRPERPREDEPEDAGTEDEPIPTTPVAPAVLMEPADLEAIAERRKRQGTPIDSHPRFLTLDDSNVAFGHAIRFGYAAVSRPEAAQVFTMFNASQLSLTNDLGLEVTVPVSYLITDIPRTEDTIQTGNMLAAVKYRFHLPDIMEGRPELTLRVRYTVPLSAPAQIKPSGPESGAFFEPANFTDLYAFLIDKHGPGFGFSTSWLFGIAHLGAQLYGDYYLTVSAAEIEQSFFALSWGASVGVQPLDDLLGVYAEIKGATTFIGPNRWELQGYLGARLRPVDLFEIAAWAALPLGSILDVSGIQVGVEFRVAWDIDSLEQQGAGRRDQEFQFE